MNTVKISLQKLLSVDMILKLWVMTLSGVEGQGCILDTPHIRYLYYDSQQYQNYTYEVATK